MKRILIFLKKKHLYFGIIRYFLSLSMMLYAISKILKVQFIVLPLSVWQQPVESLSGIALTWAFFSYSPWFQMLLGFFELIPAILLMFRRTAFLGAILLLPVLLNVLLINYAMNLWADTKQTSLMLFGLNVLILLFEWKKGRAVVRIIMSKAREKLKISIWEMAINFIIITVAGYLITAEIFGYRKNKDMFSGDWVNKHPYEWKLQSEQINDSILPQRLVKAYFLMGSYNEINDTGVISGRAVSYKLDEKKHLLQFHYEKDSSNKDYSYKMLGDTLLQLERVIDSTNDTKLVQLYKRRIINEGKRNN